MGRCARRWLQALTCEGLKAVWGRCRQCDDMANMASMCRYNSQATLCTSLSGARVASMLQDVLAIVDSELHLFNDVNLSTAVSRMSKTCDPADGFARAAQHPALARLKIAISASQIITACLVPALSWCLSLSMHSIRMLLTCPTCSMTCVQCRSAQGVRAVSPCRGQHSAWVWSYGPPPRRCAAGGVRCAGGRAHC